jgi:hypothetical protein
MAALWKRRHAEGAGIGGLNATVTVRPTRRLLDAICASVDDSRFIIPTGLVGSAVAWIERSEIRGSRTMRTDFPRISLRSVRATKLQALLPLWYPHPRPLPARGGEKACFRFTEIAFDSRPKSLAYRAILSRKRGVSRTSRTLGQAAVDAVFQARKRGRMKHLRTAKACGPDARIAGVKSLRGQRLSGAMVARGSDSPARARISRRAIAQGRPECFR